MGSPDNLQFARSLIFRTSNITYSSNFASCKQLNLILSIKSEYLRRTENNILIVKHVQDDKDACVRKLKSHSKDVIAIPSINKVPGGEVTFKLQKFQWWLSNQFCNLNAK